MTPLKNMYVRIAAKAGPEQFYRCGERFTTAWRCVTVDAATAKRLHAEQMLDVREDVPEDYAPKTAEAEAEADADADADAKAQAEADAKAQAEAAAKAKVNKGKK